MLIRVTDKEDGATHFLLSVSRIRISEDGLNVTVFDGMGVGIPVKEDLQAIMRRLQTAGMIPVENR